MHLQKPSDWQDTFYDNDYLVFDASRPRDQKVSVSTGRSFQAAMRLKKEFPGNRIAVYCTDKEMENYRVFRNTFADPEV